VTPRACPLFISRDPAAEIPVIDQFASIPHASLHHRLGKWTLRDEHSRNGSIVDGKEVDECELREGAVIQIGRSLLVFHQSPEAMESTNWAGLELRSTQPRALSRDDEERRQQLIDLLREHDGNIARVARALGRKKGKG
jgi:pSer/pThr/pTyr-binding forkhead associated (FHA) protein